MLNRWVLQYVPQLDKRLRSQLRPMNDSWRVGETYIKVKGEWKYLYRAVDSEGNMLDLRHECAREMGRPLLDFFAKR